MTDEQINIAIAEACGKPLPLHRSSDPDRHEVFDNEWKVIPDYCHDLNAMHEAENVLSDEETFKYSEFVESICKPDNIHPWSWIWNAIHATARQRAEAFLRTKGLWKP